MKQIISVFFALLLLAACGTGRQASTSDPKPESSPSSISQSALELSSTGSEPGGSSFPDGASQPPQGDKNPDTPMETDEREANNRRANELFSDLNEFFSLSKESYSYFTCGFDGDPGGPVVLEIGVMDEAAVDAYFSTWTGTKWDKLLKVPGRVSQARQEKFAEAAEKLDLGPNVDFHVTARDGPSFTETGRIFISATVTDAEPWEDIPQEIKDLASEMGIPEDMLFYLCHASGRDVTNTVI